MKDIDFELPVSSKSKVGKYVAVSLAGIIVAGSLMLAGAKVHAAMSPVRLPANQSCIASNDAVKQAAKTFSVQLVAAIDGGDAPAPDLGAVKSASSDCKAKAEEYSVKVEATK